MPERSTLLRIIFDGIDGDIGGRADIDVFVDGIDVAVDGREVLGEHHELHHAHAGEQRGVLVVGDEVAHHGGDHATDRLRQDDASQKFRSPQSR